MKFLCQTTAILALCAGGAFADTIKVGVIGPFSGGAALQGRNFQAGIEAYFALNGRTVGDHEIEIIYRDLPAADPGQSAALTQELIVGEGVQYLAGYYYTPDAMAAAPILEEANVPMVVFNAATSAIVNASPLVVRTSFTTFQTSTPMATVARERGIERVITVVSDYGPGVDSETAFVRAFGAAGGTVVESVRMPMSTVDFSPIMQRIRDSGAEAVFAFLPAGPQTFGFMTAFVENGLKADGVQLLAPGDLTQESDLPVLGPNAAGMLTTFHYAVSHNSPENIAFTEAATAWLGNPAELSFPAVGAFDGMHVIAHMIAATNGQQDAAAAVDSVKGLEWISPRGPVSINPDNRHITQNIYLREVAEVEGQYINHEIQVFENQGDPGWVAP
ncbi:amino acid ABC transporter, periplasmic amino-acid binding protein (plasmid) [Ketogulonicigenium vulgare Y25]|uniref:Amino acid ABC transporter, periplasmic amino-acid binding protein n=1 Tax=Ketogulonicigenium vulgare (strain WSH-001) TaxID=759362 RepID=F9YBX0_KETVW|nr:ABC transporter substrate-binding protein [Ketogulonicigenium vulgare]ADO44218.1 amino acid ABC transporter, periplasmic amino-acid binding protein [Ketogulonicigenium vulgare Y25]AEM42872.1 Amino acid ABC transporter, periplasmic amino-acid binding protein [Ketogulonicigenium vulgare WSH-001]ALJ82702.1 amino acid-binding protein [Ketogulonicigenium vulgare]